MAALSPRRSSRARASNPQSQQSSMSSSTSGRLERNTRLSNKPPSNKSTPTASLSSEPPEDFEDTLLGRRRRRIQEEDPEKATKHIFTDMTHGNEDLHDEEDEAVRCLCGSEDYPGRPPPDGPDSELFNAIELTEDVTGFFVQCDICKVWQHGACVGIFSAESSPDEYFCEQCRKDLHRIHTASNGQSYSKYLPLYQQPRANSQSTSATKDSALSPTEGNSKVFNAEHALHLSKRRSTMNSRDAAYDDEQLRRAIEASREGMSDPPDGSIRRTKRGRSDSEEHVLSIKRQRTASRSPSAPVDTTILQSREESDDEYPPKTGVSRKSRNARSGRDRSEREERERQRQEAAIKRRGRAERRRADESEVPEDSLQAAPKTVTENSIETPPVLEAAATPVVPPGTPPSAQSPAAHPPRKGAKPNTKRSRGRNQFTREPEDDNGESPSRSASRDIQKTTTLLDDSVALINSKSPAVEQRHGSKLKASMAGKLSLLDMRRRVAAIMDFISRTQLDLAAEATVQSSSSTSADVSPQKSPKSANNTNIKENDISNDSSLSYTTEIDFKKLSCLEMMDVLTREMVKWQKRYA